MHINVAIHRPRSDPKDEDDPGVPHPGTTPLEVAELENHAAIVDLLKQHDAI